MQALTDKSTEAVRFACKICTSGSQKIEEIGKDVQKSLCELELALLSDFLPPLDRSSIAAYAHSLCNVIDTALTYAKLSHTYHRVSGRCKFESTCISLCELLTQGTSILQGIKKSAQAPKLEEFREKKGAAMRSLYEELDVFQSPRSSQFFHARYQLISSISRAFDTLIELILKNI